MMASIFNITIGKKQFFLLFLAFGIQVAFADVTRGYAYKNISENEHTTVFLTGAAGFIGSNFLKYMFDRYPEYHFIVLDALTYAGSLENIPLYIRSSNRFEFYYGSVTNYQLVDMLMSKADLVVHFAAESHVTRSICDDTTFFETDVMGTRIMMTALVKYANQIKRYIHISTSEACGTAEYEPMDEEHPIKPRSPYAGAKAGAERLVYSYWCTYDVPAVIVRPFNNYGPRQHLEKMIPRFVTAAIKGEPLTIHGDGQQQRDWLHTLDLAKALDKILHCENFDQVKNQLLHIGSGRAISVLDIARLIVKHFGLTEDAIVFVGDRPGQVRCHISSTKKAKDLLDWQSEISFEEGIKEVIDWYRNNEVWWMRLEALKAIPVYTNDNTLELQ
jgi:dTDP-glucose 4,6-dehydratase